MVKILISSWKFSIYVYFLKHAVKKNIIFLLFCKPVGGLKISLKFWVSFFDLKILNSKLWWSPLSKSFYFWVNCWIYKNINLSVKNKLKSKKSRLYLPSNQMVLFSLQSLFFKVKSILVLFLAFSYILVLFWNIWKWIIKSVSVMLKLRCTQKCHFFLKLGWICTKILGYNDEMIVHPVW